jgi:hypothetical protein
VSQTPAQLGATVRRLLRQIGAADDATGAKRALDDIGAELVGQMEEVSTRAELAAAMREALLS